MTLTLGRKVWIGARIGKITGRAYPGRHDTEFKYDVEFADGTKNTFVEAQMNEAPSSNVLILALR